MPDPTAVVDDQALPDHKHRRATAIYTAWRNPHLSDLPVELFHRVEAAAQHLIAAIKKEI